MNLSATILVLSVVLLSVGPTPSSARSHVIRFRSPNLYPESLAWDPQSERFLAGSLRTRTILSVSDSGNSETFVSDTSLPPNSSILGLTVHASSRRLLAVVRNPDHNLNALASYDLESRRRTFLAHLTPSAGANDVTVDPDGNAYVTSSFHDLVWKVNRDGDHATVLSSSPILTAHPKDLKPPYGLNGIAYVTHKGDSEVSNSNYLLAVQTNTGKMYKIDPENGTATRVLLAQDLTLPDGIAVREDGVVLVVSRHALWFLKSEDGFGEAVVYDRIALREEGFPTSVVAGKEGRAYVLYGHVGEGMMGNVDREVFGIEEVKSERETGDADKVWVYVLLGLGLLYFTVWRFQMKNLAHKMNSKIN